MGGDPQIVDPEVRVVRVAVAAPVAGLFDYRLDPGALSGPPVFGLRVQVPFGKGRRMGFLWEVPDTPGVAPEELKPVAAVLDERPLFPPEDLALLRWAADYYRHPPGEVLAAALPVRLRKGGETRTAAPRGWRLSAAGAAVDVGQLRRAPRQSAVLEFLRGRPEGASREAIYGACGACGPILKRLEQSGWLVPCPVAVPPEAQPPLPGPPLNPDQRGAVDGVAAALGGYRAFLLEGVTGSGKTEVYLSLMERVLERGGQVLVLVPEIGLTPQLQRRLARRIRAPVALLHSALAEGEREQGWWAARSGEAAVVLGTRSAVFTPMPRLALILVDEEHDLSFKQQDGFRYSARDLAVRRAQQRRCPVLLGSATPSLESLRNAQAGRYERLHLPARAGGARPPRLELIDLRSVRLRDGLSPALIRLAREALEAGGQVLLFLNRRGYAPILTCHDCGWVAGCPRCDARLTLHQGSGLLWCHHCGWQHRTVETCPRCAKSDLRALGQGTERLEQGLASLFPGVSAVRIDRDSTRRRGSLERLLDEARRGEHRLLLGTQMLAKGHHFPDVTLVGVLDLDQGLYGADFRAAERMAQLLVQVAGRSGRAERPGRVAIQTRHPDHPLLQTLVRQGYGAFAEIALEERRLAGLPPFTAQALLRAEAGEPEGPRTYLEAAVASAGAPPAGLQFWGPVPAPMERRGGRYRAHLLVQAPDRPQIQAFLESWVPRLYRLKGASRVRWSLDVDPQEML